MEVKIKVFCNPGFTDMNNLKDQWKEGITVCYLGSNGKSTLTRNFAEECTFCSSKRMMVMTIMMVMMMTM